MRPDYRFARVDADAERMLSIVENGDLAEIAPEVRRRLSAVVTPGQTVDS